MEWTVISASLIVRYEADFTAFDVNTSRTMRFDRGVCLATAAGFGVKHNMVSSSGKIWFRRQPKYDFIVKHNMVSSSGKIWFRRQAKYGFIIKQSTVSSSSKVWFRRQAK